MFKELGVKGPRYHWRSQFFAQRCYAFIVALVGIFAFRYFGKFFTEVQALSNFFLGLMVFSAIISGWMVLDLYSKRTRFELLPGARANKIRTSAYYVRHWGEFVSGGIMVGFLAFWSSTVVFCSLIFIDQKLSDEWTWRLLFLWAWLFTLAFLNYRAATGCFRSMLDYVSKVDD